MTQTRRTRKKFLQGNIVAANAALTAGATHFFGYPITPTSEIFEAWVKMVGNLKNPNKSPVTKDPLHYLQCEDEMSSGFAMIGACMAGKKAFTTTAGPGNILMQDAFAAAEAMRIPTVAIIMQRGGLSTSTVIYSQEEVTLTCFGGNGEGFRIVYSPSNLQELYNYTIKSFNTAWKYRYPTFVLGDGYQAKMQGEVKLNPMNKKNYIKPEPILLSGKVKNIRNCYDQEEEINDVIENYRKDFTKISPKVAESESYKTSDSDILIIAHGIVASAAKVAVDNLRDNGKKVGLWRPITLRPIDTVSLFKAVQNKKIVIMAESALGQMASLIHNEFGHRKQHKGIRINTSTTIRTLYRPAIGITPEEIIEFINHHEKDKK